MGDEYTAYPGVMVGPSRVGGKPTLSDSRVPAKLVAECLNAVEAAHDIAYNYDLSLDLVLEFKKYRDALV